jgi:hypothetical protein
MIVLNMAGSSNERFLLLDVASSFTIRARAAAVNLAADQARVRASGFA